MSFVAGRNGHDVRQHRCEGRCPDFGARRQRGVQHGVACERQLRKSCAERILKYESPLSLEQRELRERFGPDNDQDTGWCGFPLLSASARAAVSGAALGVEIRDRIHERDVREGLREVAHQTFFLDAILLGEQSDIILKLEQSLQELFGFRVPAQKRVVISEPKTAGEEGPFAHGQAVVHSMRDVSLDEAVAEKLFLDLPHGAANPRIGWRKKTHQRYQ